jgi:hypothetical protein
MFDSILDDKRALRLMLALVRSLSCGAFAHFCNHISTLFPPKKGFLIIMRLL